MKETTAGTVVLVLAMALSLGGFLSVVITKLESRDAAKLTGIFLALAAMAIAVIAVLKPNTHTFGALLWFFGFSMALGFVIFLFLFIFLWAKDHVIKREMNGGFNLPAAFSMCCFFTYGVLTNG